MDSELKSLLKSFEEFKAENERLLARVRELEAERNQAVEDLRDQENCLSCIQIDTCEHSNSQGCIGGEWQWRGVKRDE